MADSNAAKDFADSMGASAKQVVDSLIAALQKYREYQEKMEKAALKEQAKIKEDFSKTLKAEGFDGSDENIEMLKQHGEKINAAEAEVKGIDQKIGEAKTELGGLGQQHKDLSDKREGLGKKMDAIKEKGDKMTPDDKTELLKMDGEAFKMERDINQLDLKMEDQGKELQGLQVKGEKAGVKLEGLKQGQGLEGLKPDAPAQALKNFKAGSNGASMMKTNSLSPKGQEVAGVKAPALGEGLKGLKLPVGGLR
ncbi:MAG: hypothetical protein JWO94_3718 [Verrucomicrobiaceae bacterium]|nr:hypothetical protein [Verrucomicrobiaceae bacterium]